MILVLMALASMPGDNCEREKIDAQIACAYSRYTSAEAALSAVWRKVKGRPGVLRAQRAWIVYKDAECEIENPATPEGREYPIFKYMCLAELTEQRVGQLTEIARR
jgi:uncharacterized protein YecT (DUF1311 family)